MPTGLLAELKGANGRAEPPELETIDGKIDEYVELTDRNPAGPAERWSFLVALLAAGLVVLVAPLADPRLGVWIRP